jgi:hypothetical protein
MALVVGTNAYTDRTFADAYLAEVGRGTDWLALGNDAKDQSLIKATEYMEGVYYNQWSGVITSLTQALAFPRDAMTDLEGRSYDSSLTPDDVKKGCCLFAVLYSTSELLITVNPTGSLIEQEVAGVIKQKWSEGFSFQKTYPQIEIIFKKFLANSSENMITLRK